MAAVRRWLVSAVVATVMAGAMPGMATVRAEDPVEATYLRYYKVVHAAERCRLDFPFGSAEQSRMARYIDAKVNNAISAGRRLSLIEQAKREVDKLVDTHGCGSSVADLLAVYEAELAPLLTP
jgi:hypothetical protein